VNVTPDSFSDGGRYHTVDAALAHCETLLEQGADVLDIGGESTRPGAHPVAARDELDRILPVVRGALARWPNALISVDTVKAEVARTALAEGAAIINDVSGLRLDPGLAPVVARHEAGLVIMHSRGAVDQMARYETATYGADAVAEIKLELANMLTRARSAGVQNERIVLDPGIGFSKRTGDSVAVLARLPEICALGCPVLIGPSRKRFIGELTGELPADQRLEGTMAACVAGLLGGARIFRVHDVQPVRRALLVAEAIRKAQL
ncbi:MAG TPA: dihydropteroate synthase, partial [Longimicrobiales bacterium]|nr:dihydropteroate synthase [Longimicrobiales bacterium]